MLMGQQTASGKALLICAALPSPSPPCNRCFLRLRALPGAGSDGNSPLSYPTPLPHDLIRSKIPGRVEASLLHPEGCDEDVKDDCDKDESCGSVVEYIQAGLLCNIIEIQTSCAIQCKKKGRLVA